MASEEELRELELELTRVVDRLNSMPLARVGSAGEECYAVAGLILAETRQLTYGIPADARLPRLDPQGFCALIAVVGEDYEKAVKAAPLSDVSPVLDRLIELRRSLP